MRQWPTGDGGGDLPLAQAGYGLAISVDRNLADLLPLFLPRCVARLENRARRVAALRWSLRYLRVVAESLLELRGRLAKLGDRRRGGVDRCRLRCCRVHCGLGLVEGNFGVGSIERAFSLASLPEGGLGRLLGYLGGDRGIFARGL